MLRRLFSLFSAFTVLFFVSVPAFATGMTPGVGVAGIPVGVEIQLDVVDFAEFCRSDLRYVYNSVRHWLDDDICPYAPQASGGHNFVPRRTMVDGQIGKYYVCEYCGKAYGNALEEAYDEYVETLPGQKVNSDGSFLWTPSFSDLGGYIDVYCGVGNSFRPGRLQFEDSGNRFSGVCSPGGTIFVFANNSGSTVYCWFSRLIAPWTGRYVCVSNTFRSPIDFSGVAGAQIFASLTSVSAVSPCTLSLDWPVFSVTLLQSPSEFSVDSRVASGTSGMYGYVQGGQLYQSTTRDIFNETTNIYNNPVTGDTSNVSSWTYDYSDRSYTLTTDEGDTVTVTYGDTNVIVNEGGTTYTVYYLTEHDESVPEHYYTSSVTLPPTCTGTGVRTYTCDDCGDTYTETIPATGHSYQSAVTMPPTCVNTGVKTFTCSACGDSYTQSIPATGHTWTVTKTVPNQYDNETGELTQAGYTLYGCSTCGEQYRIDAASSGETLPSPSTGGTSIGTGNSGGEALTPDIDSSVGRGFLATIAHGLTEDLPEVLELISEWFKTVPALYNGYSNFLAASFAWMPPDCVMLLTFSVGMVTVIAICRAMFRR